MGQGCSCDKQQGMREPEDPTPQKDQIQLMMSNTQSERAIGSRDFDRIVKSDYYIPRNGSLSGELSKANPKLRVQLSDTQFEGLAGKDTLQLKDGGIYEGETQDGIPDGKGKEVSQNGDEYVGQFLKGKRHGFGVFYKKDQYTYRGSFLNNKINGFGTIEYLDGFSYKGNFKNGLYDGEGTTTEANGKTKTGVWKAGAYLD